MVVEPRHMFFLETRLETFETEKFVNYFLEVEEIVTLN